MNDANRKPAAVGSDRYSTIAIVLHWLIAGMIVMQFVLASRMDGPPTPASFAVTQLHKSIGITILILSLARLGWRLANPPAPLPDTMARGERVLAKITHVGFYAIMIGMPLTGWIMVSTSQLRLPTVLYGMVPWPMIPALPDLAPGAKEVWRDIGEQGHSLLALTALALFVLHVAGALKHQFFSRDEPVLARMAPGAKAGRWLEPRLFLIVAALAGVAVFAAVVQPPRPGLPPPASAVAPQAAAEPLEAQGLAESPAAEPAPATPAGAAPGPAEPVRWSVAPDSSLSFESAWSGEPVRGRFERWRADILFSPEALDRSKVSVSIDLASVNTGDAQRDAMLPTEDWLGTASHPKAEFTATRFSRTAPGRYVAHGTLSLRGVSKPLDLPFRLTIEGEKAEARGTASLDRTAFGVGRGEFGGTEQIPAKVSVSILVKARAAAAP